MSINIAIDGPAGAGKSTIAKAAAAALEFIYVDTGAIYRSVTYYCLSKGISADDSEAVKAALDGISPELRFENGVQHVYVNGEDVTDKIRTPEISMNTSKISAIPQVRSFLFRLQKKIAEENNVIMDGRDIGTVVLPDADLKIYLTASPESRALRRHKELTAAGSSVTFEEVLDDVNKRDYNDMHRETAPLKKADDAIVCDTTELTLDESISKVIEMIREIM